MTRSLQNNTKHTLTIRSINNTDLNKYIGHRGLKLTDCHHNKLDANNASSGLLRSWAPVAPCQGPLQGRNPLDQAASVILVQDTPGRLRDTWHHIWAPTSASTLGWHQQTLIFRPMALYLAWSSG